MRSAVWLVVTLALAVWVMGYEDRIAAVANGYGAPAAGYGTTGVAVPAAGVVGGAVAAVQPAGGGVL